MAAAKRVRSAGIALVRAGRAGPEVLLVHPGGPYWRNKDANAWSVPKGEVEIAEPTAADLEAAARREFTEETGHPVPDGELAVLPEIRLGSSSKWLQCYAAVGDLDPNAIVSNNFEMEWPPRSGQHQSFPEVDRAAWFGLDEAEGKLHKGQAPLVALLEAEVERLLPGGDHDVGRMRNI